MPPDLSPTLDAPAVARQLTGFVEDYVRHSGAEGVVVGLSGGIDSAVAATLAARALGPDRVLGLLLPHRDSNPEDEAHGSLLAESLGVDVKRVDVTPLVDDVAEAVKPAELAGLALANAKARARMIVLYAHANLGNRLVVGTGNKSELLVGYFTKYGDGAADLYPVGDLYKTQVRELARFLGVPAGIVEKPPSAGLFPGQTDEAEMGIRYADLDRALCGLESGLTPPKIAEAAGLPLADVERVEARVLASEHKRQSLVVPKVGFRTPGLDWRSPRHRAPASRGASFE